MCLLNRLFYELTSLDLNILSLPKLNVGGFLLDWTTPEQSDNQYAKGH